MSTMEIPWKALEHASRVRFVYDVPRDEPNYVTVIVNPAAWRLAQVRKFDRAHPALAPKRTIRRHRRGRWLLKGADRTGYGFDKVLLSPNGYVTVPDFTEECWGQPWTEIDS